MVMQNGQVVEAGLTDQVLDESAASLHSTVGQCDASAMSHDAAGRYALAKQGEHGSKIFSDRSQLFIIHSLIGLVDYQIIF